MDDGTKSPSVIERQILAELMAIRMALIPGSKGTLFDVRAVPEKGMWRLLLVPYVPDRKCNFIKRILKRRPRVQSIGVLPK